MDSLDEFWKQVLFQVIWAFALFLWHRWHYRHLRRKNRERDGRINRLERTLFPMQLTQVPAAKNQWGLSSFIPGVPGRLGQKVNKLIIHWMDTTLQGADNVFTGKTSRRVSAHFGVENYQVHQYVSVNSTAWHAGNWLANLTSVGLEHSAEAGRDATDATYETSAELICSVCSQLGLVPSRDLLHKHSEFSATSCPGTIDLDHLAELAVAKWQARSTPTIVPADAQVAPQSPQIQSDMSDTTVPVSNDFTVKVMVPKARFRRSPHLDATVMVEYPQGTQVTCDEVVAGDSVNGNTTWYKSKLHGYFISATVSEKL